MFFRCYCRSTLLMVIKGRVLLIRFKIKVKMLPVKFRYLSTLKVVQKSPCFTAKKIHLKYSSGKTEKNLAVSQNFCCLFFRDKTMFLHEYFITSLHKNAYLVCSVAVFLRIFNFFIESQSHKLVKNFSVFSLKFKKKKIFRNFKRFMIPFSYKKNKCY